MADPSLAQKKLSIKVHFVLTILASVFHPACIRRRFLLTVHTACCLNLFEITNHSPVLVFKRVDHRDALPIAQILGLMQQVFFYLCEPTEVSYSQPLSQQF